MQPLALAETEGLLCVLRRHRVRLHTERGARGVPRHTQHVRGRGAELDPAEDADDADDLSLRVLRYSPLAVYVRPKKA